MHPPLSFPSPSSLLPQQVSALSLPSSSPDGGNISPSPLDSSPLDPTSSRVFSYIEPLSPEELGADGGEDDGAIGPQVLDVDTFFDDDGELALGDMNGADVIASAGLHQQHNNQQQYNLHHTLTLPADDLAAHSPHTLQLEEEERRDAFRRHASLQKTADEQFQEFDLGLGDGDLESGEDPDEDDDEELAKNAIGMGAAPIFRVTSPSSGAGGAAKSTSSHQSQSSSGAKSPTNHLSNLAALSSVFASHANPSASLDTEYDFASGIIHTLADGDFSSNPLVNISRPLNNHDSIDISATASALGFGLDHNGELDDEDEYADNAIGTQGIFSLDPNEDEDELVEGLKSAQEFRLNIDDGGVPQKQYAQTAVSRVFSYTDTPNGERSLTPNAGMIPTAANKRKSISIMQQERGKGALAGAGPSSSSSSIPPGSFIPITFSNAPLYDSTADAEVAEMTAVRKRADSAGIQGRNTPSPSPSPMPSSPAVYPLASSGDTPSPRSPLPADITPTNGGRAMSASTVGGAGGSPLTPKEPGSAGVGAQSKPHHLGHMQSDATDKRKHTRQSSLQVPTAGSSAATQGGIHTPQNAPLLMQPPQHAHNKGHARAPSLNSLSPSVIHNPVPSAVSPHLPPPKTHVRKLSHTSQQELAIAPLEHRPIIEQYLSVSEAHLSVGFPYDLVASNTEKPPVASELLGAFPDIPESAQIGSVIEPEEGLVSVIKGEELKQPALSSEVYDKTEVPTRFTRPVRRREFAPAAQVKGLSSLGLEQRKSQKQHELIQCLILFNEATSIKQDIADMIQTLTELETIQLQEVKIKKWDRPLVLKKLLNLDARGCKIKDLVIIQQIVLNSPHLYSLTISDNPICEKFFEPFTRKPMLPPVEHPIWKSLLLRLPELEYFNLIPIDHATRYRAWLYTKSKKLYPIVSKTLWNQAVNTSQPVISILQSGVGWAGAQQAGKSITDLNLSNQDLMTFNLFLLKNTIVHLNLSHNGITTLIGSGLHECKHLETFNISLNKLGSLDELYFFAHLPKLHRVMLSGNPGLGESKDYSLLVIYVCRHLRGYNRSTGLQELDSIPVTLEQRVAAIEKHSPSRGKELAAKERWRLLCIQTYGHKQVRELTQHITSCILTSQPDLSYADVSLFTGLQSLTLASNKLKTIEGLEKLTKLKYLDVRYNPELSHKLLLAQVVQLYQTIEWLSLSHSDEEMHDFTGIRFKFLCALLPTCNHLHILDHRRITGAEYIKVHTKENSWSVEDKKRYEYILNLSLVLSNTSPLVQNRRFDFVSCLPGTHNHPLAQIRYEDCHTLDISGLKLNDTFLLPQLPNLTLLNVSHNKLTELIHFDLGRFPELLFLDVRYNKLKHTPSEIATILSNMPKLYGFTMTGNTGYDKKYRQKLIACIPELSSLDCTLKIIDEFVSVEERVSAWSGVEMQWSVDDLAPPITPGGTVIVPTRTKKGSVYQRDLPDPSNKRLYQMTLKVNKDNMSIHELAKKTLKKQKELSISGSIMMDSPRNANNANAAASAGSVGSPLSAKSDGESAISAPVSPSLANYDSASSLASPSGAGGAATAASPSRLLSTRNGPARLSIAPPSASSPQQQPSSSFSLFSRNKDNDAAAQLQLERSIFGFHLVLSEHCPVGVSSEKVKELALVGQGLSWVDFNPFLSLTKLLISKNNLTSLATAGIETLHHLMVLDAHSNKLSDLIEVLNICNHLPRLEFISFFKNPFVRDSQLSHGGGKGDEPLTPLAPQQQLQAIGSGAVTSDGGRNRARSGANTPTPGSNASNALQLYTPEKYRLVFIGHLQQLQTPGRRLKYLDNMPISEDEVIRGLKELGHSSVDREMFRFNSITFGKDGSDPKTVSLNLTNRKLQRGDFSRFPHLISLNLHKNLFDDTTLLESHLTSLSELTDLDLSDNQIKSMKNLSKLLQVMPKLKILKITQNPGYSKNDSERARRNLLASFDNIHMTSFHLEYLNGTKITRDERIEAMYHSKTHWQAIHGGLQHASVGYLGGRSPAASIGSPGGKDEVKSPLSDASGAVSPLASPSGLVSPSGIKSPVVSAFLSSSLALPSSSPNTIPTLPELFSQGGLPLDLDGDIATQMENARFILTCYELGYDRTQTKDMVLRKKGLKTLGGLQLGIASYEKLRMIDLRENHLSDLKDSGIDQLRSLESLDLRANDFLSLEVVVSSLRGCNKLQHLMLQFSTRDHNETLTPEQYTPRVFSDLRGLRTCDSLENKYCILNDPLALSAQQLLWKLAKIGPNNLKRVDLYNRRLPSSLFYSVLSPLYYLDIQELLAGGNNEWCLHPQYSDIIILLLGPKFKWLDGIEINDHRRMLAYRADGTGNKKEKEQKKITSNVIVWEQHYKGIHEDVDEWLATQRAEEKRLLAAGSSAGGAGSGGDGDKPGALNELDLRVDLPNMQRMNISSAPGSTASTSVVANMMTKIEIVIHYLQVYGMVLVMDINIPFPSAFKDWSTWIRLSTLDLKDIFHINEDYKQDVLFAIVMLIPALFLGLYFYLDRMRGREKQWAESYVSLWDYIKWRTFGFYIFGIIVSTVCCFVFIDNFNTIDQLKQGKQPTPASLTWSFILFFLLSFWYFMWFRIVRLFQKHWKKDESEFKVDFKQKWLTLIHWAQIVVLFAITSLYLPIARVILMQFACDNTTTDSTYQSLAYPGQDCFPSRVSRVHYASFFFAVVYIVMLPLFLIKLISEGIAIVMELNTIHENLGKEITALKKEIQHMKIQRKSLQQGATESTTDFQLRFNEYTKNITAHKELILKKIHARESEYFNRINDPIRKLASTSLYAAYEYEWRYFKIIQLVQNLALVCISLFVPSTIGGVSEARVLLGAIAIGACFLFVCQVRPYYDSLEDGMEIIAGAANTITVLVALGLKYQLVWLTQQRADIILLIANIAAVAAFLVAIIIVPCRIWRNKKKVKAHKKLQDEEMKSANEILKQKKDERRRQSVEERQEAEAVADKADAEMAEAVVRSAEAEHDVALLEGPSRAVSFADESKQQPQPSSKKKDKSKKPSSAPAAASSPSSKQRKNLAVASSSVDVKLSIQDE